MAIIGVDIGGTNIDIGILNEDGQILQKKAIATEVENGPKLCMDRIATVIDEIIAQSGIAKENVIGIGIGCAGPMDTSLGCMVHSPNFPDDWIGFSIVRFRPRAPSAKIATATSRLVRQPS
jgi:glucokinase